jgi:hypothetical protein
VPALLHKNALVQCAHPPGQGQPTAVSPKVKVSGQPIVTQTAPYRISGCTMPPPPNGNGPCVSGTWQTASVTVKADGVPVLLANSSSICAPTGTPMRVSASQQKAQAR